MWKTQDGRTLDIRWMDSVHLVHSFNMLCRKHNLSSTNAEGAGMSGSFIYNMINELKARGYFEWGGAQTPKYGQLVIPKYREKKAVLCMFRALRDHNIPTEATRVIQGETPVDLILGGNGPWEKVIASFVAYRLERP